MSTYPSIVLPTTPYEHQREARDLSWDLEFFAYLMEMGTGKSKCIIDSVAGLVHEGRINGVLILAPKGTYLTWPKEQIPIHMPEWIDYYIGVYSSTMNKEQEAKVRNVISPIEGHIDILVMNIEALNSDRAMMFAIEFLENHNAMTVIDESDSIKNITAARTKKALTLGKLSKYRRIATGTPITQSPLDLFAQFEFLKPGCLKFTSFTAFRSYYANMVLMRLGTRAFNVVKGFRNLNQLQADIKNISYRKLKTECLDLPEKIYSTRYFSMSPEQQKLYDKLKEEALLDFEQGLVTSTSALTTIMRLQQIACGHVTLDDGTVVDIPHDRLKVLDEVLEQATGKVIIWCHFQHDVEVVVDHLNKHRDGAADTPDYAVHYYGKTTTDQRANALEVFMNDPHCKWFVGTPSTGGRGLTLVQSHTTVYYSNGYMLGERLQSEDRNHRIGQKNTVSIIDIVAEKAVDERVVKLLREKKNLADLVLDQMPALLAP